MAYQISVLAGSAMTALFVLQLAGGSCENHRRNNSAMNRDETQPSASPTPHGLSESQWGGPGISMKIGSSSVTIVFDCANAEINSVPKTDSGSRFTAEGTFTARRPGPDREDMPPKPVPAIFNGAVSGDQMTLYVKLKSGESIGDFELERGKTGLIRRCL